MTISPAGPLLPVDVHIDVASSAADAASSQLLTTKQRGYAAVGAAARDGVSVMMGQGFGIGTRVGMEAIVHASPGLGLALGLIAPTATLASAAYTGKLLAQQWGWGAGGQTAAALGAAAAAALCPVAVCVAAGTAGLASNASVSGKSLTPTPAPFDGTTHVEATAEALAALTATGVYSVARQFFQNAGQNFVPSLKTDPVVLGTDDKGNNNGPVLPKGMARATCGTWGLYSLMRAGGAVGNYFIVKNFQGSNPSLGKLAASAAAQGAITTGIETIDAFIGSWLTSKNIPNAEYLKASRTLPNDYFKTTAQDAAGRAMLNISAAADGAMAGVSLGQGVVTAFTAGGATELRGLLMRVLRAKQPHAPEQQIRNQSTELTEVLVDGLTGSSPNDPLQPPSAQTSAVAGEVPARWDDVSSSESSQSAVMFHIPTEFRPEDFPSTKPPPAPLKFGGGENMNGPRAKPSLPPFPIGRVNIGNHGVIINQVNHFYDNSPQRPQPTANFPNIQPLNIKALEKWKEENLDPVENIVVVEEGNHRIIDHHYRSDKNTR